MLLAASLALVVACGMFVAVMVGAAYAAVPLYDWFCRTTGFGGTTQVSTAAPGQVADLHGRRRVVWTPESAVSARLMQPAAPRLRAVPPLAAAITASACSRLRAPGITVVTPGCCTTHAIAALVHTARRSVGERADRSLAIIERHITEDQLDHRKGARLDV